MHSDVLYLERASRFAATIKQRSYELMEIEVGDRLLDMGCGPGIDTEELAKKVGPTGYVLGVDSDTTLIAHARASAKSHGLTSHIDYRVDDAESASFPQPFNATRSERLFMHLEHPDRAARKLVEATRSGGRVVVVDTDWGSLTIDTENPRLERLLGKYLAETLAPNGYSGRSLRRILVRAGLQDVQVEPHALGITDWTMARYICRMDDVEQAVVKRGLATQKQIDAWNAELHEATRDGCFFGAAIMVIAAGRAP